MHVESLYTESKVIYLLAQLMADVKEEDLEIMRGNKPKLIKLGDWFDEHK